MMNRTLDNPALQLIPDLVFTPLLTQAGAW
jgi:hypothetical protein